MEYPEYDSRNKYFNTEASKLFKIKRTQVEMVRDRGYDISEEEWIIKTTVDEFFKVYGVLDDAARYEKLSYTYNNSQGKQLHVFYPILTTNKYLTSSEISSILTIIKTIRDIIIISETYYTADLNKQLNQLQAKNLYENIENILNIQHFLYDELLFNITHHNLVSKHVILSDTEAQNDVLKYTTFDKLPEISIDDPVSKYFNAKIGQIIEITVNNVNPFSDNITDNYLFYRAVTDTKVKEKASK
jgi:DNA-directed RNA polymerase I, II, and III subunit RPABC1